MGPYFIQETNNNKTWYPSLPPSISVAQSIITHHQHHPQSIWCLRQNKCWDLFELARTHTHRNDRSLCCWLWKSLRSFRVFTSDLSICVTPLFTHWWESNGGTTLFIQPGNPPGVTNMSTALPILIPSLQSQTSFNLRAATVHSIGLYCNVHSASVLSSPLPTITEDRQTNYNHHTTGRTQRRSHILSAAVQPWLCWNYRQDGTPSSVMVQQWLTFTVKRLWRGENLSDVTFMMTFPFQTTVTTPLIQEEKGRNYRKGKTET